MVALIILYFNALEKRNVLTATLFLVLSVYIKLYSFMAFILLLLYPNRIRAVTFSLLWALVLAVLPLLVIPAQQLGHLYASWLQVLVEDHSAPVGVSIMSWLQSWFNLQVSNTLIALIGAVVLCLPFINTKSYSGDLFRLLSLAAVLMWVTIFNHRAGVDTYVVAICGVAIWYFCQSSNVTNVLLVSSAFIFTSLARTDLFPEYLKIHLIYPFALKPVPCIFIWAKASYELIFHTYRPRPDQTTTNVISQADLPPTDIPHRL
jgi:hypothetical protein